MKRYTLDKPLATIITEMFARANYEEPMAWMLNNGAVGDLPVDAITVEYKLQRMLINQHFRDLLIIHSQRTGEDTIDIRSCLIDGDAGYDEWLNLIEFRVVPYIVDRVALSPMPSL